MCDIESLSISARERRRRAAEMGKNGIGGRPLFLLEFFKLTVAAEVVDGVDREE